MIYALEKDIYIYFWSEDRHIKSPPKSGGGQSQNKKVCE